MPAASLPRGPAARRTLGELAGSVGAASPGPVDAALVVEGVTLDSRAVRPGDLYAALPGARTHGARFGEQAQRAGAVAVLTDPEGHALLAEAGVSLPAVVVERPREVLGGLSATVYGEPATRLTTFGITGTNGKTTTAYLLDAALRSVGAVTGLIGTVEIVVAGEAVPSARTTPEAPDVHGLLASMLARGADDVTMEVSSHALRLGRVDGLVFDVAGFTNLSQDHLDFHPTMEDYFAAKAQLFTPEHARRGVICVDDEWGRRLAARATIPVVTVRTTTDATATSTTDTGVADWWVTDPEPDGGGTRFTLHGPGGLRIAAHAPLPGDFNVANTALALVMLAQPTGAGAGRDPQLLAGRLGGSVAVPGRMERVHASGTAASGGLREDPWPGVPLAVVDYAHTPAAVAQALQALRRATPGPLVVVLGAGGDRDRGKRPGMGAAAARCADVVVVTDDNPRTEDPAAIRAAVLAGANDQAGEPATVVLEVADRRAAVLEGVRRAWSRGARGTVLVAGKGHERGQEIGGVVLPFDDREVLAAALRTIGDTVLGAPAE